MLRLTERIFTVLMLFYTTAALLPFVTGGPDQLTRAAGSSLAIGIQLGLYSVATLFIIIRWKAFFPAVLKVKWIGALVMIAIVSAAWSQDPVLTLRRGILLLATTAFGVYFGTRYESSEQLRLLAWTLGGVVCLSYLFGIFFPQYGVDHHLIHAGDWQGVFSQKNALARASVLAVLVFAFARAKVSRSLRWTGLAGAFGLLILSRSLTGVVLFAAILASLPLYKLLQTKFNFAIPTGLVLAVVGVGSLAVLVPFLPSIFEFLNRNQTMTGRTDLWAAVMNSISKRPLLGYGFDGFWMGMKGESANVLQLVHWPALHSHNGFLDLWLDLGALGLGTFIIGYLLLWRRAIRYLRSAPGSTPVWLCTYLIFILFYNSSESTLLKENSIFWVLYTSTAVSLLMHNPSRPARTAITASHEL